MKFQKLTIATALAITFCSSAAFADINDIQREASATINVSLVVPAICMVAGLDSTNTVNIDSATGIGKLSGISASCNVAGQQPKISFSSANSFKLGGALKNQNNSQDIPYSLKFNNSVITSTANENIPAAASAAELEISLDTTLLRTAPTDTYTDTITATISL